MNRQKIIWIVNEYNPPKTPRTRQIILAENLENAGYKVYIVAGSYSHLFPENMLNLNQKTMITNYDGADFIIIRTSCYSGNIKRALVAREFQENLWKYRKELPTPDIIVSDFAGWFGNVLLRWKKKYGSKIIFDIMDLWPEDFVDYGFLRDNSIITKLLYRMEYQSYIKSDGTIFSFEGGKDYIVEHGWDTEHGGKVDLSKIGYLNNGVDLKSFDEQKQIFVLDDDDLKSTKFKVVYLGSIRLANDPELLVKVAKKLRNMNCTDIILLIYGDGDYREKIEKIVTDEQLNELIKIKGRLDKNYAPNLVSRSDVNLFNFADGTMRRFGVSPNKLFMYFAGGKPVLSTIRPNYDLVESRGCGIIAGHNEDDIANAIIQLKQIKETDIKKYTSFCLNSRKVAEEFDYSKLVQVLIKMIEK